MVYENRVLRRMYEPKRNESTRRWRRLHNEELQSLYFSADIIRVNKLRKMRWAGYTAYMGEMRNASKIFIGKPEGKRSLERSRCRTENITKMNLREVGFQSVDWIHLAQIWTSGGLL
jgi:hypothetical protein